MSDIATERLVTKAVTNGLAHNRGVFIGESHDDRLAAYFMVSHMAELKKAGVTTLYVEYNALKARAAQGGQECREEFMGPSKTKAGEEGRQMVSGMQEVIRAATLAGLRVIGHDPLTGNSWQWDRTDADPKLAEKLMIGGKAIDSRDDYAAQLINRTYDGKKFIVYGGLSHSGNESKDRPSGKGLSERLGIPSIDFSTDAGAYYNRESWKTKLSGLGSELSTVWNNEQGPLHMRRGVNGEATVKVFSTNDFALVPPNTDNLYVGLDTDKLNEIEAVVRNTGVCKLPANKANREFVPLAEAEAFVNGLNSQMDKKPRAR